MAVPKFSSYNCKSVATRVFKINDRRGRQGLWQMQEWQMQEPVHVGLTWTKNPSADGFF